MRSIKQTINLALARRARAKYLNILKGLAKSAIQARDDAALIALGSEVIAAGDDIVALGAMVEREEAKAKAEDQRHAG